MLQIVSEFKKKKYLMLGLPTCYTILVIRYSNMFQLNFLCPFSHNNHFQAVPKCIKLNLLIVVMQCI
jgi:hypothetical protein